MVFLLISSCDNHLILISLDNPKSVVFGSWILGIWLDCSLNTFLKTQEVRLLSDQILDNQNQSCSRLQLSYNNYTPEMFAQKQIFTILSDCLIHTKDRHSLSRGSFSPATTLRTAFVKLYDYFSSLWSKIIQIGCRVTHLDIKIPHWQFPLHFFSLTIFSPTITWLVLYKSSTPIFQTTNQSICFSSWNENGISALSGSWLSVYVEWIWVLGLDCWNLTSKC